MKGRMPFDILGLSCRPSSSWTPSNFRAQTWDSWSFLKARMQLARRRSLAPEGHEKETSGRMASRKAATVLAKTFEFIKSMALEFVMCLQTWVAKLGFFSIGFGRQSWWMPALLIPVPRTKFSETWTDWLPLWKGRFPWLSASLHYLQLLSRRCWQLAWIPILNTLWLKSHFACNFCLWFRLLEIETC